MNAETMTGTVGGAGERLASRVVAARTSRAANYAAEQLACHELASRVAHDPLGALRRCLELARELCGAGSAGVSVLRSQRTGQPLMHWQQVSGALSAHTGVSAPRNASLCGSCLDFGASTLVKQPEKKYAYLSPLKPLMTECLQVPLYDHAHQSLGTLWVAHHDAENQFCANDLRVVEQLAAQAVLALVLLEQARQHNVTLALLEAHERSQQLVVAHHHAEQRHRDSTDAAADTHRKLMAFKDLEILEVHHRVKNSLLTAASLLMLQARNASSAAVSAALRLGYGRLNLLAKAHQLLYKSDDAQQVLMPKLLQTVGDALWESFAELSANIELNIVADAIALDADHAIPLALLANEVMTNAYQHAFPPGGSGEISVSLRCEPAGMLTLQIADNGKGMQLDQIQSGLGMELVHGLAEQLHGQLSVGTSPEGIGTIVTLVMPKLLAQVSLPAPAVSHDVSNSVPLLI